MKNLTLCALIFIFLSCSNGKQNSFNCYLDRLTGEQKAVVKEIDELFYRFIDSEFSNKPNLPTKIRAYCLSILSDTCQFELKNIDTNTVNEILNRYDESGLVWIQDMDIKKYGKESARRYFTEAHFKALRNCNCIDRDSTLVKEYLSSYDNVGDLSLGRFPKYMAEEATIEELNSSIYIHLLIIEYFIPRLRKKNTLPNNRYKS